MEHFLEWVFRCIAGGLVAAFAALFGRLRTAERDQAVLTSRVETLEGRDSGAAAIGALREELHRLQLTIERNFVRREEWVPHISRILGALEMQGKHLERLDATLQHFKQVGK